MKAIDSHQLARVYGGAGGAAAGAAGQLLSGAGGALGGVGGLLGGIASLKQANTQRKVAEAQIAGGGGGGGGGGGAPPAAAAMPMAPSVGPGGGDDSVKITTNVSITR